MAERETIINRGGVLLPAIVHEGSDYSEIEYTKVKLRKGPSSDSDTVDIDPTTAELSAIGEPANGMQKVRVVHDGGVSEEYYQSVPEKTEVTD